MPDTNTSIPQLVLYPKSVNRAPKDLHQLKASLLDIGFISAVKDLPYYLPGNEFVNLLAFLGCSPDIRLGPEDGDNYCQVVISDITNEATCLGFNTTIKPKCPACKTTLSQWQHIANWQQAHTLLGCTHCDTETELHKFKWRHECGYGRFAIRIRYIYPHEAVPSEALLASLEDATGFGWNYCYITQQVTL